MTTFVLVPGACHGGWCYEQLTGQLRERGHQAVPVTLTGVGDPGHAPSPDIDLDRHIEDALAVLPERAVLVGHSYGGMVITGVADRAPRQVAGLVYLDAFVPRDGDSCWTLTDDEQRAWYTSGAETGLVPPLPFFEERATAHPLAAFRQPIKLSGDLSRFRKTYAYATEWPAESPFKPTYDRLRTDSSWTVHAVRGKHNLMRDAPDALLDILLGEGP